MTPRIHGWLRMLLAVVTFACAAVAVTADPAAAAPTVVIVAPVAERASSQVSQRALEVARALEPTGTVAPALSARAFSRRFQPVAAPALVRAPRLYLRNCVLLR